VPRMPPPSEGEALKPDQIAKLRRWIDAGAPAPADEKPEADPREHWAFRAPQRPGLPVVGRPVANPIDALIADQWQRRGLVPQPDAEPRLLLRRLYLDLVGVPPSLEEQEAFLRDTTPDAYERVVDRLLQSPQHGERWARHWMDIWRYSDWYGLGQEVRNSQKHIWHWRDWIVESVNADKGYDQMLREMLAADELYPDDVGRLRATGFLARQYFKFNRTTWLDDTIEHTSKAFLGLTLNCAKCHDHKYDPLKQADFYRFRAFFEPYQIRTEMVAGETDFEKDGIPRAFDCNLEAPTYLFVRGDDRQPAKNRPLAPGLPKLLSWGPLEIQPVKLPREAYLPQVRESVFANYLAAAQRAVSDARRTLDKAEKAEDGAELKRARAAFATAQQQISTLQARRAADLAVVEGVDAKRAKEAAAREEKRLAFLQAEEALARAELDVAHAEGTKKADAEKKRVVAVAALEKARRAAESPGEAYTPLRGALKTLESNVETEASRNRPFPTTSTGRRSALAMWITDPRNPLTARVAVNHLWARHFGTPLVATDFDFGRKGAAPTHPELLDWLALELMEHGWSMKHLHRLIVTSEAYRLSSSSANVDPTTLKADPENRFLWRRQAPRMEAQVIRDSVLSLGGALDPAIGGPSIPIKDELSPRRSLYFFHSNNENQRFLSQFDDASVRECYRRSESIVPQQALTLANSKLMMTYGSQIADQLQQRFGAASDADFVRGAFHLLLATTPTAEEAAECLAALAEWRHLAGSRPDGAARARTHLVRALLNHNDFITIR
jgi:hypothetical protein